MIVRISSSVVPETNLGAYLAHVEGNEVALRASSPGLIAVWLLDRPFVAYVEVLVVSVWESEESMTDSMEKHPPMDEAKSDYGAIQLEARTYRLLASRDSKPGSNLEQLES